MNNELQLFNFKGRDFTVILLNDEPHWIAKEICNYLELSNPSVALNGLKDNIQKKLICGDILSQLKQQPNFNLGSRTAELNLLTEAGVYKLVFKSRKPNAEEFTDWLSESVLPALRKTGKFDSIEEQIKLIKDEKEKELSLGLYSMQQALKANPNDLTLTLLVKNKETELKTYQQDKKLEVMDKKIEVLEKQSEQIKKTTVLREGDLSAEAIARRFNIFSLANKPHNRFADYLAKEIGFYRQPTGESGYQDEYISINLENKFGKTTAVIKYSKLAVKKMEEYIEENGLNIEEPAKYYTKGDKKGKFNYVYINFESGERIKVNQTTYQLYTKNVA